MHDVKWDSGTNDSRAATDVAESKVELIETGLAGNEQSATPWRKIRGGILLGVGCVTSPCCTPVIVPAALALLAGTPLAAFLAQYVGWVYGTLTVLSLLSLFFGARALWLKSSFTSGQPSVL